MPSELTLFFSDDSGHEQEIAVRTNPFTIGRQEGNELVIPDASLSRRHALITVFNDIAQIADCGSQNGTLLNGQPISGNAVLKNGDVITVGHRCQLRVRLTERTVAATPTASATNAAHGSNAADATNAPPKSHLSHQSQSPPSTISPTMLALLATGVIVLIALVLIVVVVLKKPKPTVRQDDIVFAASPVAPTPSESIAADTSVPAAGDQLETSLKQVIRNISNDQTYPFAPAVLDAIRSKAAQYATPTLATTLRTLAARGKEAAEQIRGEGLKPPLLFYLALADTNGGQAGDPLAVARQAMVDVRFLSDHFGNNFADQCLLVVAAYKIPGGNKKTHPLLEPLRRLIRNPQTDRNVWFLREKGALSDAAYDFLLRFLAYGAIAQNPRQFGLDAPALSF